jgi:uncharacterized protein YcfL
MNRKIIKHLTLLLTIIFLVIFVAGCSSKDNKSISASDQVGKAATASISKSTSEISNSATKKTTVNPTTNTDETVYITNSGNKYHKEGCKSLQKSKKAIKKSEAIKEGYEPCHICKPN